jgi:hypothetical protein
MVTSAGVGLPGILSGAIAPFSAASSVPLGSLQNFGFNQFAYPWFEAMLPLFVPGENGVVATTMMQYLNVLSTTIANLLAG